MFGFHFVGMFYGHGFIPLSHLHDLPSKSRAGVSVANPSEASGEFPAMAGVASGWVSIRRKEQERGYSTTSPRNDIMDWLYSSARM
jgi:hypothetical protein